jgi:hypothetical protein
MIDLFGPPRPLDHLVLPTASLDVARARLSELGFTVAPTGVHPFGTENACVYFADGTFLEPLAVVDEQKAKDTGQEGNVFTARDAAYRYRRSREGFSAVVFRTDDARKDHADFVGWGLSGGPMLEFSRDFVDADGRADRASFRLAFAADLRAPDVFFFTCQRLNVPDVDRTPLQLHANGVASVKAVVLAAPEASAYGAVVRAVSGADTDRCHDSWFVLKAANASIMMMNNNELRAHFGALSSGDRGLEARGIVFGAADLKTTKSYLASRQIECEKYRERLIVLPAPGQGAIFAFEEA